MGLFIALKSSRVPFFVISVVTSMLTFTDIVDENGTYEVMMDDGRIIVIS